MSDSTNSQPIPPTFNFFMGNAPAPNFGTQSHSSGINEPAAAISGAPKLDTRDLQAKPLVSPIVGGFNAAAMTVTWSAEFSKYIGDLDVRDWQPEHTQAWLTDMFKGAEQLDSYLSNFKKNAVKGQDLLTMNDPAVFNEFGISNPIHVNRIKSSHAQLVAHQNRCDEKKAAQIALEQSERTYFDIKKKYEKLMALSNPAYSLPTNIISWKPEDVFAFLMLPQHAEQLHMFVRPLALSSVGGEKLLELAKDEAILERRELLEPLKTKDGSAATPTGIASPALFGSEKKKEHKGRNRLRSKNDKNSDSEVTEVEDFDKVHVESPTPNVIVVKLFDLSADPDDIKRLKRAVNKFKTDQEDRIRSIKQDAINELWKNLGPFDRKKLIVLEQLGQGSFGTVYRGQYEKKKVVVKQLKDDNSMDANADNRGGMKVTNTAKRTKEQRADDIRYEATMLLKAECSGVLKLIAIDADYEPPRMITEYMCNKTVENEYQLALSNDPESIFHIDNDHNKNEKANGVLHPVLLQMIRIARDVASALTHIHKKGIIHMDIAARNILLDLNKRPKIADFGCAAMEADMLEILHLRKEKSDEDYKKILESDSELLNKDRMYSYVRPTRWMPYWIYDSDRAPKIDRKADVYSFGCVMYEMHAKHPPHDRASNDEVKMQKRNKLGNPPVPADMDGQYASIMKSCWEDYDRQISIDQIASQLSDLHRSIATQNFEKDSGYVELLSLKPRSKEQNVYSFISAVEANASSTSVPPSNYPKIAEGRVRLKFDKIDLDDAPEHLAAVEQIGYDKVKFQNALKSAFQFRDHDNLALYMLCIRVESSDTQIELIVACLNYLERLASDQHGSTGDDDTFQRLCFSVLEVVYSVTSKGANLATHHGAAVVKSALGTLASLLRNKSLSEIRIESTYSFENELCKIVFAAFNHFSSDPGVVQKASTAVFSLSKLSQLMMGKLYQGGIIGLLLTAVGTHENNQEVVLESVKALSCFPIQYLIDPNPATEEVPAPKPATKSTTSASSNSPKRVTKNPMGSVKRDSDDSNYWCQVFDKLFYFVHRGVQSLHDKTLFSLSLVETCLTAMFRMCESGIDDTDLVNRLLHHATGQSVADIMVIIREFPDNFRIQEGAIGLLAHILNTGGPISTNSDPHAETTLIIAPASAEQRLSALLEIDPKFKLLLDAMEKFKFDNKVSTGIASKKDDSANEITPGVFTSSKSAASNRVKSSNTAAFLQGKQEVEEGISWESQWEIDEMGEEITAAHLQRSVAMILGIACNSRKFGRKTQDELIQTRYNENILSAFGNFPKVVPLIRFGCHALFFTCRRHKEHQSKLQGLFIIDHLNRALKRHQSVWEVVEAVICAFMGMLEPPMEISRLPQEVIDNFEIDRTIKTADNNRKLRELTLNALEERKKKFMGHKVAIELAGPASFQLQVLALVVAGFQVHPECHGLVKNYLKLLSSIGFWLESDVKTWSTHEFVDLQIILQVNERVQQELVRNFGKLVGRVEKAESQQNEAALRHDVEGFVNFMEYRSCSVFTYVFLSMKWHRNVLNVIAAGLSVITAIIRDACKTLPLGAEITDYADKNSLMFKLRIQAVNNGGVLEYCKMAKEHREDNPILIRYSLWLLIIFISEKTKDSAAIGQRLAAQLSIDGCMEWAIAVAQKYTDYFSLQVLSTWFLLWMDIHGLFENKDLERWSEIRTIARRNVDAIEKNVQFRPLEEEGHDTYLLGETDVFGDLASISYRLLNAVAVFLPPETEQTTVASIAPVSAIDAEAEAKLKAFAKSIDLSENFARNVPFDIKSWTNQHTQSFISTIFLGSEDLNKYLAACRKETLRGSDLLDMDDSLFEQLGIVSAIHKKRMTKHLECLKVYQKQYELEKEAYEASLKTDQPYFEMDRKLREALAVAPNGIYALPLKIESWKPIDVFAFLKMPVHEEKVAKFIKPICLTGIDGEQFLDLTHSDTLIERRDYEPEASAVLKATKLNTALRSQSAHGVLTMRLYGYSDIEPADVTIFKKIVNDFKIEQNEKARAVQQEAITELWKKLGTFDRKKLTILEQLGQGSFGSVYRAVYEKKKVVVKQLFITKESASSNDPTKEDLADDLKYEAIMLLKAEGSGVVKLIAIDADYEPPRMITEYLCNKTVENEYQLALMEDTSSIFHPNNPQNLEEKDNNGIADPVLLQVLRISRDIASALARIHDLGIIHLDVAARNILLDLNKRPKLADFGCAVMESDMLQIYDWRLKKTDAEINKRRSNDPEFARKFKMYHHERNINWMPYWAITDPKAGIPRIDRKTDVYSFGALMYEMITQHPPHEQQSREEVIKEKLKKLGDPQVPSNLNSKFSTIMLSCWEHYDKQSSMTDISVRLLVAHHSIATENYEKDSSYTDVSSMLVSRASGHSLFSNSSVPLSRPVTGKIRLQFDGVNTTMTTAKRQEIERSGYPKQKLEDALNCAINFKDHRTVSLVMMCVSIENNADQIDILGLCLDYLELLAGDQHCTTDDGDNFLNLSRMILEIANKTEEKADELGPDYAGQILCKALSSLSALLINKSFSELPSVDDESNKSLESELCKLMIRALFKYSDNADVIGKAAAAVFSLSGLSLIMLSKLHIGCVIYGLLSAMKEHQNNEPLVIECVRALSCFPIQLLTDPRPSGSTNPYITAEKSAISVKGATVASGRKTVGVSKTSAVANMRKKSVAQMPASSKSITQVSDVTDKGSDVYSSVSYFIRTAIDSIMKCIEDEEECGEYTEFLLETCLTSLFNMCESGLNDSDLINRLLHQANAEEINALVSALRTFPDNFRIQQGAIGMLAHLMNTGLPIFNRERGIVTSIIVAPVPADERLAAYLKLDPSLKLALTAMKKFRVNDQIAIGIESSENDFAAEANISTGVFHNTQTTSAATATKTRATATAVLDFNSIVNQSTIEPEGEEDDIPLEIDSRGEQITSAPLQRSVAVLLGISCNSRKKGKEMQDNLRKTQYNQLLLLAFRNFRRDVSLIRFGCHALSFTCRRNADHQKMLNNLFIFDHLYRALDRHKTIWEIVEAVICAVTGMLEPPQDVSELSPNVVNNVYASQGVRMGDALVPNLRKKIADLLKEKLQERKKSYIGNKIARELTKSLNAGGSLLQSLAISVAEFQVNGECSLLVMNFFKLLCGIGFWIPEMMKQWNTDVFLDISRLLENSRYKQQFLAVVGRTLAKGAKSTTKAVQLDVNSSTFDSYKRYSVLQFVLLSLKWHGHQSSVLASGLAIITAIIRQALNEDAVIGDEIIEYKDFRSPISVHRKTALTNDIVGLCMEAMMRKEDNPILIRYSLWLLVIFISERNKEGYDSEAMQLASRLGINGCLGWAQTVASRYKDYYSLQVLCSLFLIWMEHHGRFDNVPIEELEEIRTIQLRNIANDITSYRALEEEGHDTYLLGENNSMFGDLKTIANKLLRLAVAHIEDNDNEPVDVAVQETVLIEEFELEQYPVNIQVTATSTIESADGKQFTAYQIQVTWDSTLNWRVARRFSEFIDLKDKLEFVSRHVDINCSSSDLIRKTTFDSMKAKLNPKNYYEQRKSLLQRWMDELRKNRSILYNEVLLQFLDAHINAPAMKSPRVFPSFLNVGRGGDTFPVQSVHFDAHHNLLIVGIGINTGLGLFSSTSVMRGSVTVYRLIACGSQSGAEIWTDGRYALLLQACQCFNVGVVSVSYDPHKRIVIVGLSTGPILFYYIGHGQSSLTYCCEVDCHSSLVRNLIIETTSKEGICFTASQDGVLTMYDLNRADMKSQCSTSQGVSINCIAHYGTDSLIFCGTNVASVVIYDVSTIPPTLLKTLSLPNYDPTNKAHKNNSDVTALVFENERRLLYCAYRNVIHVFRIYNKKEISKSVIKSHCLQLKASLKISNLLLLNHGQFLVASETRGSVAVFDMSQKPVKSSSSSSYSSQVDTMKTGAVVEKWQDVIKLGNAAMKDWLIGKGIDVVGAKSKGDLIRLVATTAGVDENTAVDVLIPDDPRCDVIFTWSTVDPLNANDAQLNNSCYIEPLRVIVSGGANGRLTCVSLADFIPEEPLRDPNVGADASGIKSKLTASQGRNNQV